MTEQQNALLKAKKLLEQAGFCLPNNPSPADISSAISEFQRRTGLKVSGKLDQHTIEMLTESQWKLGDRLLYLRSPMLSGQDVAELQRCLVALGFDLGKIDGIFGPATAAALKEFQRQVGITVDGIFGPASLREIKKVITYQHETFYQLDEIKLNLKGDKAIPGSIVVCSIGSSNPLSKQIHQALAHPGINCQEIHGQIESELVTKVNELSPDLCIAISVDSHSQKLSLNYYKGFNYESSYVKKLAINYKGLISYFLTSLNIEVEICGLAVPILRQTRMPTLLLEACKALLKSKESKYLADSLAKAVFET